MEIGRIVYSRAGRDAGSHYVVVELIDDAYVAIANGCLRKVDNPKKKKMKACLKSSKQNQFVLYGKKYKNIETTLKITQKTSVSFLGKNLLENPQKTYKRSNVGKNQKCPQTLERGTKIISKI